MQVHAEIFLRKIRGVFGGAFPQERWFVDRERGVLKAGFSPTSSRLRPTLATSPPRFIGTARASRRLVLSALPSPTPYHLFALPRPRR
eukprot:8648049-Pyramimonas_sp.AAC.1